jgi:hypothetical protein
VYFARSRDCDRYSKLAGLRMDRWFVSCSGEEKVCGEVRGDVKRRRQCRANLKIPPPQSEDLSKTAWLLREARLQAGNRSWPRPYEDGQ